MTNEVIIEKNRQALVAAGIITENEAIHTYETWKAAGLQVKRGEKAVAKFPIWKKSSKEKVVEVKTEDGEKTEKALQIGRFYMKESCFFSSRQVEQTSAKKPA